MRRFYFFIIQIIRILQTVANFVNFSQFFVTLGQRWSTGVNIPIFSITKALVLIRLLKITYRIKVQIKSNIYCDSALSLALASRHSAVQDSKQLDSALSQKGLLKGLYSGFLPEILYLDRQSRFRELFRFCENIRLQISKFACRCSQRLR